MAEAPRVLAGLSRPRPTPADLEAAREAAVANERSGKSEQARKRLKYKPRK